jgi:hypothetical protein
MKSEHFLVYHGPRRGEGAGEQSPDVSRPGFLGASEKPAARQARHAAEACAIWPPYLLGHAVIADLLIVDYRPDAILPKGPYLRPRTRLTTSVSHFSKSAQPDLISSLDALAPHWTPIRKPHS